jgi:hypothetical protein
MLQLKSTGTGMRVGLGTDVGVGVGVIVGANVGVNVGVSVGIVASCISFVDSAGLAIELLKKATISDTVIIKVKTVTKTSFEFRDTVYTTNAILEFFL